MSLGGGPPQRMPVKTPWKVEDIVVSIPPAPTHTPQALTQTPMRGRPSLSEAERRVSAGRSGCDSSALTGVRSSLPAVGPSLHSIGHPFASSALATGSLNRTMSIPPPPPVAPAALQAIRERRQSARNAPDDFMGRVPGMTPGRTKSTSPVKERRPLPAVVPEEAESSGAEHHRLSTPLGQPGILGQPSSTPLLPDTRGLLDRMMSTIEDMKERRRQSLAASPIKPTRPPPRMEESEDEDESEVEQSGLSEGELDEDEVWKVRTPYLLVISLLTGLLGHASLDAQSRRRRTRAGL